MIHLQPDEKILMVVHRHWIVFLGKILVALLLCALPIVSIAILGIFGISIGKFFGAALFLLVIYLMCLALFMFILWISYYLDVWIITSRRIIDVEQHSLFSRSVSECLLERVENVNVEVPGVMATFLKFGNVFVETAGERDLSMHQIPNVYDVKNMILDYSQKIAKNNQNNVGTQQVGTN